MRSKRASTGRAPARAGCERPPAQRRSPPAILSRAGPLGYQGRRRHEADQSGRRGDALGSRRARSAPCRSTAWTTGPRTRRFQVEADHTNLGLVKEITVGLHADAKATASAPEAPRPQDARQRCDQGAHAATIKDRKDPWEKKLDVDPRARPVQPGHDQGAGEPHRRSYLHPRQVCASWRKPCRRARWSSTDIGNINSAANSYWASRSRASSSRRMSFGNCG